MPVLVGTSPVTPEEFPLDTPTRLYLGDSGIVLADGSVTDEHGCVWKNTAKDLWGTKPAPREQVGDLSYDHGQWDATEFYGPRLIPINGSVRAPDHATLHAAKQRLFNALGVKAFRLRGTEPGYDSWTMARQQGDIDWFEDGWNPPHATFAGTLYAKQPQLWSSLERAIGPILFPSISGGLVLPATPPLLSDAVVVNGSQDLLNPGNEAAGLVLKIVGPVDAMTLSFPDLGKTQHLVNPDGPLLTAGQWLTLDTQSRLVWLNDNARRRSWTYGDWLILPPSSTTTLSIDGSGTTTDSYVSGSYRAARI